jgi:hypothetical protein
MLILNGESFWLILVKFIENSKKIEKCKTNFVGFPVNNSTTFTKHDPLLNDSFCMKNRN